MKASATHFELVAEGFAGRTTAIAAPDWGANVYSLSYQNSEMSAPLHIFEAVEMSRIAARPGSYGMPILGPFAGRVGVNQSGAFAYEGKHYLASPARHGFLRENSWEVVQAKKASISCKLDVRPESMTGESAFPFNFAAAYTISLNIQELRCVLSITSRAAHNQPLSVGWHPYLARENPCEIHIPASTRWILDGEAEPTPTGERVLVSGTDDFRRGRMLSEDEHWDDIFSDLAASGDEVHAWSDEISPLETSGAKPKRLRIRRQVSVPASGALRRGVTSLSEMQLYTPKGRDAICLEPLSAPPNAVNLRKIFDGSRNSIDLKPGETRVYEIRVSLAMQQL